ncbi:MAG: RelA/SpoT domain-containing protein [Solirubrobacteraceae bacterium]|nr:RelA/SpoT domain-containing protein [Solirubrobacteraceae bacterium]
MSRSEIDRAGVTLTSYVNASGDPGPTWDEFSHAVDVMIKFRKTFQTPMNKTAMGLRSMVMSCCPEIRELGGNVPVVQRLKRSEQILLKLNRFPNSKLSNMGDIGGVRAVLSDRAQVDRVAERIAVKWETLGRTRDTRDVPAPTGYRALHIIVLRDGRRIEVQLRTPDEHEWAVAVERTGQRLGFRLKEGMGPPDLKEYFRLASHGMYADSQGIVPDQAFRDAWEEIHRTTAHYFRR